MKSTGYSGTTLIQKLGFKPSSKILLVNAPAEYFEWLGPKLKRQVVTHKDTPDFIHLFIKNEKELFTAMKKLEQHWKKNTSLIIWVSWYKKSSKIPTDVTEDSIRNYALANNLVDVKVCAVSDEWSALKLVVPLTKR